jgi:hypothetical protein
MDRRLNREQVPLGLRVLVEGRASQRVHDAGVQAQYLDRTLEIRDAGGRVLGARSELQLKRVIAKDRQEHLARTGELPDAWELEQIAKEHGTGSIEGHIKIPDNQVTYREGADETVTENQDYMSGRGKRLAMKVALGFKIGGLRRGKKRTVRRRVLVPDTVLHGRSTVPSPVRIGMDGRGGQKHEICRVLPR